MNQVVFLCLLSLTLCLGKPADSEVPASHAAKVGDAKVEKANEQSQKPMAPAQTTVASAQTQMAPVQTQAAPKKSEESPKPTPHPETQKATTDSNKTNEKKEEQTKEKTTEGAKAEPTRMPANTDVKPMVHNETKPSEMSAKNMTSTESSMTPKPTDTSKTEEPKANVTPKDDDAHIVQSRGFDGPSFMGGIILSLGLLAIGFMGFKYYKNQTERNYHTL